MYASARSVLLSTPSTGELGLYTEMRTSKIVHIPMTVLPQPWALRLGTAQWSGQQKGKICDHFLQMQMISDFKHLLRHSQETLLLLRLSDCNSLLQIM